MAEAITSDLPDTASLAHLLPPSWKADIQRWFAEDTPSFDWAGYVVGEEEQEAILWGKSGVSCQRDPVHMTHFPLDHASLARAWIAPPIPCSGRTCMRRAGSRLQL